MDATDLARLADDYYRAREARLALDKEVAKLEEVEKTLKATLLSYMQSADVSATGGQECVITLKTKATPTVKDWATTYEYIKAHDAFDLLQRRLNGAACELRREDGLEIPGVEWSPVATLSVSKRK